jgi:replicative DNA helicase
VNASTAPSTLDLRQGRSVPQSSEAEAAVLGAMLLDTSAIGRAVETGLREEDFYQEPHRAIFRSVLRLYDKRQVVDPVTLREDLRLHGDLAHAGGEEYLAEVVSAVPTTANVDYHARIVLDNSTKRKLISVGTRIVADTFERPEDADTLLDQAEKRIFEIADRRLREGFVPINQLLLRTIELAESLSQNPDRVTGVPSGFLDLDHLTAGFQLSDLIIVAGRPSMGKCVAHDAEVVLQDGSLATIEDICRRRAATLLTLRSDWKLRPTEARAFVDDGLKPVFRVTTRLGRSVETTITHPYLTIGGWKPLSHLRVGDRVAVPRRMPVFGNAPMRECEVKLLGYLIGDGGLTRSSPKFTNSNPRVLDEYSDAVREFGDVLAHLEARPAPTVRVAADPAQRSAARLELARCLRARIPGRSAARVARAVGVSSGSISAWSARPATFEQLCTTLGVPVERLALRGLSVLGKSTRNPLAAWLEDLGLMGEGARDKHVPEPVFRIPRAQLAVFLNRFFATDGWISVLPSGQPQLGYATVSERLARQVQHLLLRFGVVASLRKRLVKDRETCREAWQIDITDHGSIRTFVDEIGIFGKEEAVERVREALRTRALSRTRLGRFAEALASAELRQLSDSDVYWDEIVAIEPGGLKQVYDLTIPQTHNFVANDVCVHNTALALNIAQNASIRQDIPVAVFSLEMSKDQLVQRVLCSEARIDAQKMRTGHLSREEWQRIVRAADRLQSAKIYLDDTPGLSILEMRAKARRLKSEVDLGLIVIDYLQLMEVGTGPAKPENRQQEISVISRSVKGLAKELNVPVIALSQLSRAPEQRTDHRPNLSDLRESGALEQDADVVLFIYRDEVYNPNTEKGQGVAEIIIGKHRNGPTGAVTLRFAKESTRFDNYTPRAEF